MSMRNSIGKASRMPFSIVLGTLGTSVCCRDQGLLVATQDRLAGALRLLRVENVNQIFEVLQQDRATLWKRSVTLRQNPISIDRTDNGQNCTHFQSGKARYQLVREMPT